MKTSFKMAVATQIIFFGAAVHAQSMDKSIDEFTHTVNREIQQTKKELVQTYSPYLVDHLIELFRCSAMEGDQLSYAVKNKLDDKIFSKGKSKKSQRNLEVQKKKLLATTFKTVVRKLFSAYSKAEMIEIESEETLHSLFENHIAHQINDHPFKDRPKLALDVYFSMLCGKIDPEHVINNLVDQEKKRLLEEEFAAHKAEVEENKSYALKDGRELERYLSSLEKGKGYVSKF